MSNRQNNAEGRRKYSFRCVTDDDFEILWKAYQEGSFNLPKMTKLGFLSWFSMTKSRYHETLIVECDGVGIAFVCAYFDGWKYEPHVEFFAGVSARRKLESTIEFFDEMSKRDDIGVIVVKALKNTLFEHLVSRKCLTFVGVMPNGDYRGDEYIYSRTGNAVTQTTKSAGRI